MIRHNPDEYLRDLERRAAAGDLVARGQLHRERRRRGIPSNVWQGARQLHQRAARLVRRFCPACHQEYVGPYAECGGEGNGSCCSVLGDHELCYGDLAHPIDPELDERAQRAWSRARDDAERGRWASWHRRLDYF